ncbi:MAG: trigger factor [Planctomycetota bacterium]|jgi:trigger factor
MAEEQEAQAPQNSITIEEAGPCKKKVIIEIPEETIKTATEEQYETLRKDAQIPGFRKGRAPRRLLEKRFGKESNEQVKLKLLADASDSAIKDNQIKVLRDPDIDFENIKLPSEGPMTFDFEVEVRPEFDLPSLEGITVKKTKLKVTDEQVDREIEQFRKYSGLWAPRDGGEVEAGDQIIADATLTIQDKQEPEKLNNIEIFVRHNGFVGGIPVENLDEFLAGAKVGEVRETSVFVPKTYFREEYRGKKVDIRIVVEDIKWLKPAELNEKFFARFGVESVEELQERMRDNLHGRLEQQTRTEMTNQIYKYMLDHTDFELPTDIVADQANTLLQRRYVNLIRQGLSREQLDEQIEQLKAGSEKQAQEQLKTFFIMEKVSEKLEIDVTEEEVNGHIAQLAIQQGQRPEKMREQMLRDGSFAQFRLQVREDKCIAKLLESAKITEIKAKKTPKKTTKAKKNDKSAKKTTRKTAKKGDQTRKITKKTQTKAKSKTSV